VGVDQRAFIWAETVMGVVMFVRLVCFANGVGRKGCDDEW
jgi:hypothetical protein